MLVVPNQGEFAWQQTTLLQGTLLTLITVEW
jgi:hypothetical protein